MNRTALNEIGRLYDLSRNDFIKFSESTGIAICPFFGTKNMTVFDSNFYLEILGNRGLSFSLSETEKEQIITDAYVEPRDNELGTVTFLVMQFGNAKIGTELLWNVRRLWMDGMDLDTIVHAMMNEN